MDVQPAGLKENDVKTLKNPFPELPFVSELQIHNSSECPLSLAQMKELDTVGQVRMLTVLLDNDLPVSADIIQYLMEKITTGKSKLSDEEQESLKTKGWFVRQSRDIDDKKRSRSHYNSADEEKPVPPGVSKNFPNGLVNVPENNLSALVDATIVALEKTDPYEHGQILSNFLNLLANPNSNLDYDTQYSLVERCLEFIDRSPNKKELRSELYKFLAQNSHLYSYSPLRESNWSFRDRVMKDRLVEVDGEIINEIPSTAVDSAIWQLTQDEKTINRLMDELSRGSNDEVIKKILGMVLSQESYPVILNHLRSMIQKCKAAEGANAQPLYERSKLERLGRLLYGFNPDDTSIPFYADLGEVYDNVEFGEYPPNRRAIPYVIDLILKQYIPESKKKNLRVLDQACGAGPVALGLAQAGVRNITGVDISDHLLDEAREESERISRVDRSGSFTAPKFIKSDWIKNSLPSRSVDLLIFTGRSPTHAESIEAYKGIMAAQVKLLAPGAVMVFDNALLNEGQYSENRAHFRQAMINLGIPSEKAEQNLQYIIDGPGPNAQMPHKYNRVNPSEQTLRTMFQELGCSMKEIARDDIMYEEYKMGVNVYYEVMKLPEKEPLAMPNQTMPSLSAQSVGVE